MKVTQLLARLSYGPLSNISMGNDGDGTIAVAKHPAIIQHANDGLLRLYTKFILNEAELILEEQEAITSYKLHSDYAVSTEGTAPTVAYIRDTEEAPFTNDLIKVLHVYRTGGQEVALNDATKDESVYTPQFDVLQIPDPVQGAPLYLLYQAKHAELVHEGEGYLDQVISLPDVLHEALVEFVAYKVYSNMNGQEHTLKAKEHHDMFEKICADVIDKDLVNTSQSNTDTKFSERGFV